MPFVTLVGKYDLDSFTKLTAMGYTVYVINEYAPLTKGEEEAIASSKLVVLSGGEDIQPNLYGEKMNGSGTPNPIRDAKEYQIMDICRKDNIPVFGFCRGCQILNVYLGGKLYQDMLHVGIHNVNLTGIGRDIFDGLEKVRTNTFHHQAVKEVGEGVEVIGTHSDGTIELTYHSELNWLGVQWHPERMTYTFEEIVNFLLGANDE